MHEDFCEKLDSSVRRLEDTSQAAIAEYELVKNSFVSLMGIVSREPPVLPANVTLDDLGGPFRSFATVYGGAEHEALSDRTNYGNIDGLLLDPTPDGQLEVADREESAVPFVMRTLRYTRGIVSMESSSLLPPLADAPSLIDISRRPLVFREVTDYDVGNGMLSLRIGVIDYRVKNTAQPFFRKDAAELPADTVASRVTPMLRTLHAGSEIFKLMANRDSHVTVELLQSPGTPGVI